MRGDVHVHTRARPHVDIEAAAIGAHFPRGSVVRELLPHRARALGELDLLATLDKDAPRSWQ